MALLAQPHLCSEGEMVLLGLRRGDRAICAMGEEFCSQSAPLSKGEANKSCFSRTSAHTILSCSSLSLPRPSPPPPHASFSRLPWKKEARLEDRYEGSSPVDFLLPMSQGLRCKGVFSPDGALLASCSRDYRGDNYVRLWDAVSRTEVNKFDPGNVPGAFWRNMGGEGRA